MTISGPLDQSKIMQNFQFSSQITPKPLDNVVCVCKCLLSLPWLDVREDSLPSPCMGDKLHGKVTRDSVSFDVRGKTGANPEVMIHLSRADHVVNFSCACLAWQCIARVMMQLERCTAAKLIGCNPAPVSFVFFTCTQCKATKVVQ